MQRAKPELACLGLWSAARVDLYDMPIRVQHIDLREACGPMALHQEPPPAPLRGVLSVAMPDQVVERGIEVLHPQGEVAVVVVNLRVGSEGGLGVNYEMDLRGAHVEPSTVHREIGPGRAGVRPRIPL